MEGEIISDIFLSYRILVQMFVLPVAAFHAFWWIVSFSSCSNTDSYPPAVSFEITRHHVSVTVQYFSTTDLGVFHGSVTDF